MDQPELLALEPPARRQRSNDPLLGEVFHGSYRRLVVQLYAVIGDAAEAEDVVQEAFVRAASVGRRFARVENPEAWLRTTALNVHRNRWRSRTRFLMARPRLASSPTDLPGLDEHLAVIEALRQLPEQQRQVLALHYLADLPVADIAAELGVAEGTVKSRLSRGRESMARLLRNEEEDTDA